MKATSKPKHKMTKAKSKPKTMHNTYGEPNDKLGKHLVCDKCGCCIDCKDCKCNSPSGQVKRSPTKRWRW